MARGETDRLMVFMPPGSAKTTYTSVLFPTWFLAQRPGLDLIGASYNGDYADDISLAVQRVVAENGDILDYRVVSGGAGFWRTTKRGQYRAAGAGSGITGRRGDLIVIDDPIKGREDADSETIREKVWKWYRAEVITRLKPKGRIVLVQTRWHHDDLAGRLLEAEKAGADKWRVINLPALAEENDALGRKPGEALWPEWENEEALDRKRQSVGPREWSALFQQRPTPTEGAMFLVGMLQVLDAAPTCVQTVRAWDFAASEATNGSDPDWTVGIKMGRTQNGSFVILDVIRFRGGPDIVLASLVNTAKMDGIGCKVSIPQDPGQAGKMQVLAYVRALAGFTVNALPVSGSKEQRAGPVASQVNLGNVAMVRNPAWNLTLRDELGIFPAGSHDDQVDALSQAFSEIGLGQRAMQISAEAMSRFGGRPSLR